MTLKIKDINLDGHSVNVPVGLSEILTNGNGWGVKHEELHIGYSREVVKRNGRLITVLTKRGENK